MLTNLIFPLIAVVLVFSFKWFFSTLGKTKFVLADFDYGIQLYIAALLLYVRFLLKLIEGQELMKTFIPAIHLFYVVVFFIGFFIIARVILGLKTKVESKAGKKNSSGKIHKINEKLIVLIPLIVGILVLFFVSSIIK